MNALLRNTLALTGVVIAAQAAAQVTFFEHDNFQGQSFSSQRQIRDFARHGFNDRASSAIVVGERWEVCENSDFSGRCIILRAGRYPSLAAMGLNDQISSARTIGRSALVDDQRYAPLPVAAPDFRRRNNERLYEANVISVHAVVGPPEQRCWIEREQIPQEHRSNAPATIAGALIGGILGHQVGGGSGRDLATVGGAIAGAAVGAQVSRNNNNPPPAGTRDVQRCQNVPSQARAEFWDVTYNFRGQEHQVQLTSPPGPTITVNNLGEPRK